MLFMYVLDFLIRKLTKNLHYVEYPVVFDVKHQPCNPV